MDEGNRGPLPRHARPCASGVAIQITCANGLQGGLGVSPHAAVFDIRVACQNVWVTDDLAAVAMWDSPGKGDAVPGHAKSVWAHYHAVAGDDAFERLALYHDAVAAVSPAEPHWYLGVLATFPHRQGEGLATALLTPIFSEADRLGLACCLETSTAHNRRFYERRGFTQATEVTLPGGPAT